MNPLGWLLALAGLAVAGAALLWLTWAVSGRLQRRRLERQPKGVVELEPRWWW